MSNYFSVFLLLFWKKLRKYILCSPTRQRPFPFLLKEPYHSLHLLLLWKTAGLLLGYLVVSPAIWKGKLVKQRHTV